MFIDEVDIKVVSGKGGDGLVSWRREKYIPKGGPRGGDAGDGGSIYLQTDVNINTLSEYRNKKVLRAQNGEGGGTQLKHGANAPDLILKVPVGTIVIDKNTKEILSDLKEESIKLLVVKGGKGGFGNAHFCSSTRQAPAFAELGDISEERDLHLELKLVADIGIIGIPSSGKSTFIGNITNVKPKIGDYPFTTLTPNLGVLEYKGRSLVLEDVPGLIPGASEGKGLGIEFLKHIERTGVLIHLLDLYRLDNIFQDYEDIRYELESFSNELKNKQEIVCLSKADLLDNQMKDYILGEFKNKYPNKKLFIISCVTGEGIEKLVDFLIDNYSKQIQDKNNQEIIETRLKVYDLKDKIDPKKYRLNYIGDYIFECFGQRIEQIVRMTDFENKEAVLRVYDVLEKMGITQQIEKQLETLLQTENKTNDFFFEGNDDNSLDPKIIIAGKSIPLDKLRYNL